MGIKQTVDMEEYMKSHPTPWRVVVKPRGWGDSTVIYDKNNNVVLYETFPPKVVF